MRPVIAAAIKADICEIYTDVDGIYTADPNICPRARKLKVVSYDEMLNMGSLGAKVLQTRSVELAMRFKVPLRVLSSFEEDISETAGTYVCDEEEIMEDNVVSGVAYSRDEANALLAKNTGVIASFSRALTEGLSAYTYLESSS